MGIERRRDERIVISGNVLINLRDTAINCSIENISNYGAYLKVENPDRCNNIEIGEKVTFNISTPDFSAMKLSGQILRRSMENQIMYLAIYFFQPYTFGG